MDFLASMVLLSQNHKAKVNDGKTLPAFLTGNTCHRLVGQVQVEPHPIMGTGVQCWSLQQTCFHLKCGWCCYCTTLYDLHCNLLGLESDYPSQQ